MSDTSSGILPEGWTAQKLESLVTLSADGGIPRDEPSLPFVGMEHVERNSGDILNFGDSVEYKSSAYIVKPGQVLYGRLRPYLNKVFMPSAVCYASREFIPMTHGVDILPKFLLHRIRASDFVQFAISLNAGDRPRVKWPQMNQFVVLVPPLAEQQKIVEILEEQLSRLDAALISVRTVRDKAAQFRRSLLHAAFTGALTQHDSRRMSETSTTTIPEGWKVKTLGELVRPKYGKSLDKSLKSERGTYPVVGSAGTMAFTEVPLVSSGALVVGRKGNVGDVQLFLGGCWPIDTTYYFEAPNSVTLTFFHLQLVSLEMKKLDSSTTTPSLRREDLEAVQILLPSLVEQKKIVEILDEQLSRLDASLVAADAVERRAAALRRSLLHASFTGKLTEQWREGSHV